MKKIRITVMRMASYPDLSAAYENPLEHACDMQLGHCLLYTSDAADDYSLV